MQPAQFGSTFGFLMAATGFAVGLGNIWRFPYITGENGGGAFVLIYIGCALLIGVPILMAEILIGRRGAASPPDAIKSVAIADGRSTRWALLGHLNLSTAFVIQGTYTVVAGWVLWYLVKAITTGFADTDALTAATEFSHVQTDVGSNVFWSASTLALTGAIIYFGVNKGIERTVKFLMPMLFVLMIILVLYNTTQPGFGDALAYLFTPDFSKVDGQTFLAAIGQAFFSIGVAMAGMMIYGAYLPQSVSIPRCVLFIITVDTSVALLAGLMIFPIVFRFDLDPAGGPGLIFQTLPVAFSLMPGGQVIATMFFTLLLVAAITSSVGLLEPLVAWYTSWREKASLPQNHTRHSATLTMLGLIACVAFVSILSYSVIADWQIASLNLTGIFDYLSNQIMLPVGGLLIAVFAGWQMDRNAMKNELGLGQRAFTGWFWLIRFLLPIALIIILITGLS